MVSNSFYFHPELWGRFPILSNIFQMGLKPPTRKIIKRRPVFFFFVSLIYMFGKNDQPEDLDLLTLQLKLGWKMKGTGVMGHYPIFWGRESNHANGILTNSP